MYGIGGYNELRTVYGRSNLFDSSDEPRRLHLGIDIWGKAGTPIMAPIGGMVHSVAFNDNDGDYGATIILAHQLQGISFYGLYGHLSFSGYSTNRRWQLYKWGKSICAFRVSLKKMGTGHLIYIFN